MLGGRMLQPVPVPSVTLTERLNLLDLLGRNGEHLAAVLGDEDAVLDSSSFDKGLTTWRPVSAAVWS